MVQYAVQVLRFPSSRRPAWPVALPPVLLLLEPWVATFTSWNWPPWTSPNWFTGSTCTPGRCWPYGTTKRVKTNWTTSSQQLTEIRALFRTLAVWYDKTSENDLNNVKSTTYRNSSAFQTISCDPFIPLSAHFQISPIASPEIQHHTIACWQALLSLPLPPVSPTESLPAG